MLAFRILRSLNQNLCLRACVCVEAHRWRLKVTSDALQGLTTGLPAALAEEAPLPLGCLHNGRLNIGARAVPVGATFALLSGTNPLPLSLFLPHSMSVDLRMSVNIEKVVDAVELGEGPHWDVKSQKLYYVDINGQKIMRYDPATGQVNYAYMKDGHVGVAVPVEGTKDKLIAGVGRNIVLISWDGESSNDNPPFKVLASIDTDRTDTRINDGKCDPAGRFWAGTMGLEVNNTVEPNRGALYLMGSDSSVKKVLSPISISNGLTWSPQEDVMYYIDSLTYQIWAYDYNNADGSISNKRVIFDLKSNNVEGLPDGMTNDADGNLWVALFNGKAVIQIDPKNGKLLRKIDLPVDKITSVTFGGPQLDVLYVTSAYVNMTAEERQEKPDSGALYSIKGLGVKGCPPTNFKYNVLQ